MPRESPEEETTIAMPLLDLKREQPEEANGLAKTTTHSQITPTDNSGQIRSDQTQTSRFLHANVKQLEFDQPVKKIDLINSNDKSMHVVAVALSEMGRRDSKGQIQEHSPQNCRPVRTVTQHGRINLAPINVPKWGLKYTTDIFTTLLEFNWGWTLFTFCFAYFGSWILFAGGWFLILYFHGDLEPINQIGQKTGEWRPCITGIGDFTTSFLFSVETQHTTGYGFYQLTEECPIAILLFCIQSIVGVILEGLLVGLVFMKMSGSKKRAATLMFSRNACISRRDGKLFFQFRCADTRKTRLLEAHVRAHFVRNRVTAEGQIVRSGQQELSVHGEGEHGSKVLLFWPTIILHEIDENSPFHQITEKDLVAENRDFEVIVVLEGIIEATGITTQARSSYLPHEILMGYSFKDLTESSSKSFAGERQIDYSGFHETIYTP